MFAFTSLAVLALATLGVRADLVISTPPSLTLCQKANFQVTGNNGGTLYAAVVRSSDPCGEPLQDFDVKGTFDWTVDIPAGETVMLAIEDEAGNEAFTGPLTIQAGDSSCLTSASASSSSSATVTRTTARVNNGAANAASAPTSTEATSTASRPVIAGAAVAGIAAAIAAIAF